MSYVGELDLPPTYGPTITFKFKVNKLNTLKEKMMRAQDFSDNKHIIKIQYTKLCGTDTQIVISHK